MSLALISLITRTLRCNECLTELQSGVKLQPPFIAQDIPSMFAHDTRKENAVRFARLDREHLLSTASPHPVTLEGEAWRSAEHYFQAQLAGNVGHREKIIQSDTPEQAYKLGNLWYKRKRKDWKGLRRVLMTRALYTKVQMYPVVEAFLQSTGDELIVETSLYDHYWGIGRDQRGENMLGKVWMDIRKKLREDEATA